MAAYDHSNCILIITVTKVEAEAVFDTFLQKKKLSRAQIGNKTYYKLGSHGGIRVYMVQSEMGTSVPGGPLLTRTPGDPGFTPSSDHHVWNCIRTTTGEAKPGRYPDRQAATLLRAAKNCSPQGADAPR